MTSENFCYWLQGFSEIHGGAPTPEQWQIIKEHLNLVFHKVTPNHTPSAPPPVTPYPSFPYPPSTAEPYVYPESPICGGEPIWRVPQPGEPGEIVYCAPTPQTTTLSEQNICCSNIVGEGLICGCVGPEGEKGVAGIVEPSGYTPPHVDGYPVNTKTYADSITQAVYNELVKEQRAGGF